MKKQIYILLISLLIASFTQANSEMNIPSHESRLRKISLLLKGVKPSYSELNDLSEIKNTNDKEDFVHQKINEYLNTADFVTTMSENLNELFRVQIKPHESENSNYSSNGEDINHDSSLNQLFADLVKDNKSWDILLTNKEYKITEDMEYNDDPRGMDESDFYEYNSRNNKLKQEITDYLASNSETPSKDKPYVYKPKNKDSIDSLAGALTTNRFFSRYPNTRINKNRKRAAAIFRVFLCDNMSPALIASKSENMDLLNLSTGESNSQNTSQDTIEKSHGEDPQCKSCHYKLDPAAKTFIGSGAYPNRTPSPGALVYKKEDGTLINIPVNGIGELGQAITQQSEYLECQTEHFWSWFIGSDIPLNGEKKKSLAQKFNSFNRKPKDFIKYLLTSEDFINPEKINLSDIRFSNVKPILKKCDSCHSNEPLAPNLSQSYPYSKENHLNDFVIEKLILATDLKEEKSNDFMPPKSAGWSLESLNRDLLKAWILGGAKDDQGKAQITPNTTLRKTLDNIKLNGYLKDNLEPEFGYSYYRYLNNNKAIRSLLSLLADKPSGYTYELQPCEIDPNNSSEMMTLGFLNPNTGRPLFSKPAASYLQKIRNCGQGVLVLLLKKRQILSDLPLGLIHPSLLENNNSFFNYFATTYADQTLNKIKWSDLSAELQKSQISQLIDFTIGSNVLSEEQRFNLVNSLVNSVHKLENSSPEKIDLENVIVIVFKALIITPEFLTY